ncbi:MAG TPA: endonuclease/exonuclease/phosphatase family protein [Rubrobacteraceae bacterium]|nr:endonuclease/exonuclease/phosphatase family protein [Rubrobacteraceae bacterium]
MRVMTFNIRGFRRDAGTPNAWKKRVGSNVEVISRCDPDVIGLQECQPGNLKAYRRRLPHYGRIRGPRYGNRPPHDFNAILFHESRLEVVESGGFWLSETPEEYSRSWETRVARSANWVLFRSLEDGEASGATFLHLNTHLDHRSKPARVEGSRLVVRKIAELRASLGDPPVIVTGDFNAVPGSAPYRNFVAAGFTDAYLAAGNEEAEDVHTFHNFRGPEFVPRRGRSPKRLDWVMFHDSLERVRVESCRIARYRDEGSGTFPSDHYPVVADLSFGK